MASLVLTAQESGDSWGWGDKSSLFGPTAQGAQHGGWSEAAYDRRDDNQTEGHTRRRQRCSQSSSVRIPGDRPWGGHGSFWEEAPGGP